MIDATDFIFAPEPGESTERRLSFLDFLDLILSLRGTNIATMKDIVDLRKQLKSTYERLKSKQLAKSRTYATLSMGPDDAQRNLLGTP
ncbi:unnamed protein product [Symbiodinium natans]|uniref:Uncharacterized protein n=1 Tax=Symbiodinium natans TaxID=878477 RepID=A0A812NL57_9DINO|nr:unnamed protein product [Symbiodinium natans]